MNHEPITDKRVIGIVGPIASGKGVLVSFLIQKGYRVLSLSDVVREKTKAWGLPITRENLQNVGDNLRQKFGNAFLAELIGSAMLKHPKDKFVIDAIRNPAEVAYLKKEFGVYIIGITASSEKRFELLKKRAKEYDPTTWEEFVAIEKRDRGIAQQPFGQQVEVCLKLSDVIFDNNGTLEDFKRTMPSLLENITGK